MSTLWMKYFISHVLQKENGDLKGKGIYFCS